MQCSESNVYILLLSYLFNNLYVSYKSYIVHVL